MTNLPFDQHVKAEIMKDGTIKATINIPKEALKGQFRFNTTDSVKSEGSWLGVSQKASIKSSSTDVSITNDAQGKLEVILGKGRNEVDFQFMDSSGKISTVRLSRAKIAAAAANPSAPATSSATPATQASSKQPTGNTEAQPLMGPSSQPSTQSIDVEGLKNALSVVNPDKGNPYSSHQFKDFNAAIAILSAARNSKSLGAYGQTLDALQKDIIRTTQPYQIEPFLKAALSPSSLAELSIVAKQAEQFWTTKRQELSDIQQKYNSDANFKAEMDFGWAVKHQFHRGRDFRDQLDYLLGTDSQTSTANSVARPVPTIVTTDSNQLAAALARGPALRGESFANKANATEILNKYGSAQARGQLISSNRDELIEVVRKNPAALDLLLNGQGFTSQEVKDLAQNFFNAQSDMRGSSNKQSLNGFHQTLRDNPGYATLVDLAYEVNHKSPWYRLGLTKAGSMLEQLKYELGTEATDAVETDLQKFEEAALIRKPGK